MFESIVLQYHEDPYSTWKCYKYILNYVSAKLAFSILINLPNYTYNEWVDCFSSEGLSRHIGQDEEAFILIHSLRDANLPKFLAEDVPLFVSILADLFPGITPPQLDQGVLEVRTTWLLTMFYDYTILTWVKAYACIKAPSWAKVLFSPSIF